MLPLYLQLGVHEALYGLRMILQPTTTKKWNLSLDRLEFLKMQLIWEILRHTHTVYICVHDTLYMTEVDLPQVDVPKYTAR